jgi:hypothetical protein
VSVPDADHRARTGSIPPLGTISLDFQQFSLWVIQGLEVHVTVFILILGSCGFEIPHDFKSPGIILFYLHGGYINEKGTRI